MEVHVYPLRPIFWTAFLIFINLPPSNQECFIGNPIIDPPSLAVKYGAPATATCRTPFHVDVIGWNATLGAKTAEKSERLVWSVDRVTDWSLGRGVTCYTTSEELGRCQTHLPITIYKIPDRVTLVLLYPSVPLIERRKYTLYCDVHNVAPLANLTVRWFKADKVLATNLGTNATVEEGKESEAATVRYRHVINVSKEDHRTSYRCSAKLDTTELTSNSIRVEVLYKPRVINASEDMSLKPDARLDLVCEGEGNPSPWYRWKRNGVFLPHENKTTLSIESVNVSHAGVYECIARNTQGDVTVSIKVNVEVPTSPVTGVLVVIAVLIIIAIGVVIYRIYHRRTKTDYYHFRQLNARSKSVVATIALQEKMVSST